MRREDAEDFVWGPDDIEVIKGPKDAIAELKRALEDNPPRLGPPAGKPPQ